MKMKKDMGKMTATIEIDTTQAQAALTELNMSMKNTRVSISQFKKALKTIVKTSDITKRKLRRFRRKAKKLGA